MIALGLSYLTASFLVFANVGSGLSPLLEQKLTSEIQKRFPRAKIELLSGQKQDLPSNENVLSVKYIGDNPQGLASMAIFHKQNDVVTETKIQVPFRATLKVAIASKRLKFGERISVQDFRFEEVDVTSGMNREIIGLMITDSHQVSNHEAHQTIIEGQSILSSAIIPIPDVKRGDPVKLKVLAGALSVQSSGIAQEASYEGQNIRVMNLKTKKELSGILREGRIVEVAL